MRKPRLLPLLLLTALFAQACETEVREANIDQDKYIDDYITRTFPDNPVHRGKGTVRVVLTEGIAGGSVIERGDSVYLFYAGFTFGQSGPQNQFVLDSGMVRVGGGQLIRGLEEGLAGARLGEESLIFFSADDGYGSSPLGLVPANSALMFDVGVGAIKKNP